jgi:hypothetical protein
VGAKAPRRPCRHPRLRLRPAPAAGYDCSGCSACPRSLHSIPTSLWGTSVSHRVQGALSGSAGCRPHSRARARLPAPPIQVKRRGSCREERAATRAGLTQLALLATLLPTAARARRPAVAALQPLTSPLNSDAHTRRASIVPPRVTASSPAVAGRGSARLSQGSCGGSDANRVRAPASAPDLTPCSPCRAPRPRP